MYSCKLDQPVYIAATEFEFEETEEGFFIHHFVISNQVNANNWMVTSDANKQDGKDFEGQPDILFFNDKGIKDHTTGKTKEESLRVQEPFRKGTIKVIKGSDIGKKLTATSKIEDEKTKQLIRSHDIRFVSPAIFPKSLEDVEIVRTGPNTHIHIVHRYDALHVAFVDDPAYGIGAAVGPICEGNGKDCMIRLQQIQAGIGDDDVDPLREVKLVKIKASKCSKTGNLIFEMPAGELSEEISKCLSQKLGPGEDPTDKDLAICFDEARNKLKQNKAKESKSATASFKSSVKYSKGTLGDKEETDKKVKELESKAQEIEETLKGIKQAQEETKEEKDKAAKKAQEDEEKKQEEARKSAKGKKAEDMTEEEKKQAQEDEEKKEAQEDEKKEKDIVAKVASEMSIKSPLVEKYIQAKTAQKGLDAKAQSELRIKMLSASVEEIESKLDDIEAFVGISKSSSSQDSPIGQGGVQTDGQLSASTKYDDLSGEELEEKAMGSVN